MISGGGTSITTGTATSFSGAGGASFCCGGHCAQAPSNSMHSPTMIPLCMLHARILRQDDPEVGAAVITFQRFDAAVVRGDELPRDRQAEAAAFDARTLLALALKEPVENLRAIADRYTGS